MTEMDISPISDKMIAMEISSTVQGSDFCLLAWHCNWPTTAVEMKLVRTAQL